MMPTQIIYQHGQKIQTIVLSDNTVIESYAGTQLYWYEGDISCVIAVKENKIKYSYNYNQIDVILWDL